MEFTRRRFLGYAPLLAAAAGAPGLFLAGGCSLADSDSGLVRADLARRPADPGASPSVTQATCAFSIDLVKAVASQGNLICSPFSVLMAMAMVRNGAVSKTADEIDATLHLPDLAALNAGLNSIDQTLATRSGKRERRDGSKDEVSIDLANAVWGQSGFTWQQPLLETLATDYGTGVREQDFAADPAAAIRQINSWVADQTRDKIPKIVGPDVITVDTRMVLANAIYLKGPWLDPFSETDDRPFETPAKPVTSPMILGMLPDAGISGDGYQAARILLAGEELAMTVVLPEQDLPALITKLAGTGLTDLLTATPTGSVELTMPTYTFDSDLPLTEVLKGLGIRAAFSAEEADFSGLTTDAPLVITDVLHRGWVGVDKDGVEAAAATVVGAAESSAPMMDFTLVLDRPFLFCLHDVALGLPLLIGIVNDPTSK